jgi:hypothetical protein
VKKVLNGRLDESIKRSREVIESPWNPNLWAIVQRTIRMLILAMVYGLAFAAGSQRRGSDLSLLREAQMQWDLARATRLQRRRERLEERERQLELQQQDEMEARARAVQETVPTTAVPPPARVTPSRGLPADMAYFHQLSVEEEDREPEELS